jgi:Asp-tRNA(Asn)/Glu-tRNA(Gln) amidotransferase A subunit family amidase
LRAIENARNEGKIFDSRNKQRAIMNELFRLGAGEAAERLEENGTTALALVRSCFERIEQLEPRIQAWQQLDTKRALARAAALDAERAGGAARGVLDGVPVGIKDIIDVGGLPTAMGSPLYRDRVAQESAEVVRRLERAGAVIMGKTVTTEFAYFAPGKTHNPWNTAHTPGGSSSGSAAAVACGMVPAALGTQTAGSVIRPAAFCGIVGFKPTRGLVPNHGTLDYSPTLDQTGVLARSVADAGRVASVMASAGRIGGAVQQPASPPRLAAVRTPVWRAADAAQAGSFVDAIRRLSGAGATVSEVELPAVFSDAHTVHSTIMTYEASQFFRALQDAHRADLSDMLNRLIDAGRAIPAERYREAVALRQDLIEALDGFLSDYDAIITPPARGEAPATLGETGDPTFCVMWTLTGVPAISIPVELGSRGLPLALQIVGRSGDDDGVLSVAAWCERQFEFSGWLDRDDEAAAE